MKLVMCSCFNFVFSKLSLKKLLKMKSHFNKNNRKDKMMIKEFIVLIKKGEIK